MASAAFLAAGAALGCSDGASSSVGNAATGAGNAQGASGSNGTTGGSSATGTVSQGSGGAVNTQSGGGSNATGGAQSQGGAALATGGAMTSQAGQASGGTTAAGGTTQQGSAGAGVGSPGQACEGFTESTVGALCRNPAECPPSPGMDAYCYQSEFRPNTYRSSAAAATVSPCADDDSCGANSVCVPAGDGVSRCTGACQVGGDECDETRTCVGGGCIPKACDQEGAVECGDGFDCRPGAEGQDPAGCVPQSCLTGFECWAGHDCDPGADGATPQGCVQRKCTEDSDCDCGYCMGTGCVPTLGYCEYDVPAMPYGCVWPDEELV